MEYDNQIKGVLTAMIFSTYLCSYNAQVLNDDVTRFEFLLN